MATRPISSGHLGVPSRGPVHLHPTCSPAGCIGLETPGTMGALWTRSGPATREGRPGRGSATRKRLLAGWSLGQPELLRLLVVARRQRTRDSKGAWRGREGPTERSGRNGKLEGRVMLGRFVFGAAGTPEPAAPWDGTGRVTGQPRPHPRPRVSELSGAGQCLQGGLERADQLWTAVHSFLPPWDPAPSPHRSPQGPSWMPHAQLPCVPLPKLCCPLLQAPTPNFSAVTVDVRPGPELSLLLVTV